MDETSSMVAGAQGADFSDGALGTLKVLLYGQGRNTTKGNGSCSKNGADFYHGPRGRRIGRLSPYAKMDHHGFIMDHGRELKIYRRRPISKAA